MRNSLALLTWVVLWSLFVLQNAEAGYQLEVMFYEYKNPSHLCAECGGSSGQIACCDDVERTADCSGVGPQGCDTRMRWTRRPFGTPNTTVVISQHFEEGTPGFISDARFDIQANYLGPTQTNPLELLGDLWPGSIQFYVEALDAREPGTEQLRGPEIDRFVIDLNISLGADFTTRTTYSGFYGLASLDLSFRVSCIENYFGQDCSIMCTGVARQSECNNEGQLICIGNRNQSTGCVQCVSGYRGSNCEIPDCSALPCQNGGTCVQSGAEKECRCPQSFEGDRCELMITTAPPQVTTDPTTMAGTTKASSATTIAEPSEDNEPNNSNTALIGGVVGGLSALFLIVIILLLLTIVLVVAIRSRRASKLDIQVTVNGGGAVENPSYMIQDIKMPSQTSTTSNSYTETTTNVGPEHNFDNPLYDANSRNDYSDPWDTVKMSRSPTDKAAASANPVHTHSHPTEEPPVYAVAHKPHEMSSSTQSKPEMDDSGQGTYARTDHSLHSKFKQHKYEYIDHTPPVKDPASTQPVYHYADSTPAKSSPPLYDSAAAGSSLQQPKGGYDYARLNPPPAYTNTTPGHVTREASEHYDMGQ